jgi:hypothetical protein
VKFRATEECDDLPQRSRPRPKDDQPYILQYATHAEEHRSGCCPHRWSERSVVVIPNAIKRANHHQAPPRKSQSVQKSMTISKSSTSDLNPQIVQRTPNRWPRLTSTRSAGSTGALASRIVLVVDRRVQVLQINDDIRDQSAFWRRGGSFREGISECICPRRAFVSHRLCSRQVPLFFSHVTNRQAPVP